MPPWIGQGMSAGVRDAANLCWKLAAVVAGRAPDSLLDSYQAERKPHVMEVTRRACLVGRVITERNRTIATARNHVLRAATSLPGVVAGLLKLMWIPDARYRQGFFAGDQRAVGWQIPQPWVIDTQGATVRLDDILGGRWSILHTGAPPPGAQAWSEIGVRVTRLAGTQDGPHRDAIRDVDGTLSRWLRRKKAAAVVLRPDGFIYAAAESGQPLAPPPDHTLPAPINTGATA
jgi:3-(3-hydroxy-phenyl)propionate hydroxylase